MSKAKVKGVIWSEKVFFTECPVKDCDHGSIEIGNEGDSGFAGIEVVCPKCKTTIVVDPETDL